MLNAPATRHITLPDNRILSYVEYGDPDGKHVLYIHGSPGSHLDWYLGDPEARSATAQRLHIIAPDRPGFGESTFLPDRQITDWPNDVRALIDVLGIDTFDTVAVSGGAPFALAMAHSMPERMRKLAILCGVGPMDVPGITRGMGVSKLIFRLSRWLPFAVDLQYRFLKRGLMNNPSQVIQQVIATVSTPDQKVMQQQQTQEIFLATMAEALRQGSRGLITEGAMFTRPWRFALTEITVPTHLWYGTEDRNVTMFMGEYLAEKMPDAMLHIAPGEGHFSVGIHCFPEVLDYIMAQ